MQIKTTMRYHFTLVIKMTINKFWRGCGKKGTLLMAMQTGAATMASIMEVPQKLKVKLPYDPAIHFWTFIQRKQNANKERYLHHHVHCSIIYNCQDIEET